MALAFTALHGFGEDDFRVVPLQLLGDEAPRMAKSRRRTWEFPSWETREPFDPMAAVREAELRHVQLGYVDFQGQPWDDAKPPPPSVQDVASGLSQASAADVRFPDPNRFVAGRLGLHAAEWDLILASHPQRDMLLEWVREGVDVHKFIVPFSGSFEGTPVKASFPPSQVFVNKISCKPFAKFISDTLLERLKTKAISLWGKVGESEPPYLVMPLTVEPTKPRLCCDQRFLNLFVKDCPFTLDKLVDVTRYVEPNSFQTKCDDKSGYDHVSIRPSSRTLLGFQWAGYWFVCNTLPFGFKSSAFVYNTLGLAATGYIRSLGVPATQYIDDRHAGQLRVAGAGGQVAVCSTQDNFRRAEAAVFIMTSILVRLGYVIGLEKSILIPTLCLVFLGYLIKSITCSFGIPVKKRVSFRDLRLSILEESVISVKTLQRFVGKAISFTLAVPAAQLFTRECNLAIGKALRKGGLIRVVGDLRREIEHWAFVDDWRDDWPWREEKHVVVSIASDASKSKWGGVIRADTAGPTEVGDMWLPGERSYGIPTKEALALLRVLQAAGHLLDNARVDALVDSMTVVDAWRAKGGKTKSIFDVLKDIFWLLLKHNSTLNLFHVRSDRNPADPPSRRFSAADARLSPQAWRLVEQRFGPHVIDGMALPSNTQTNMFFSWFPTPGAAGVNFFAQPLGPGQRFHKLRGYIFPPFSLIGAVLAFVSKSRYECTVVVPEFVPAKFWWPVLNAMARDRVLVGNRGTKGAIWYPSKDGFVPTLPPVARLWLPAVACPECQYPNDKDFRFCRPADPWQIWTTGAAKPHGIGVIAGQVTARHTTADRPMKGPHKYYFYGALPGTVYLDTR
ncbi:hypothetical protein Bbelb_253180 [Branchiostoma belcheri]|nr:hypothetical protein Bbelb_253180 [Branchiostoma belcheri]